MGNDGVGGVYIIVAIAPRVPEYVFFVLVEFIVIA